MSGHHLLVYCLLGINIALLRNREPVHIIMYSESVSVTILGTGLKLVLHDVSLLTTCVAMALRNKLQVDCSM